ncbi:Hypothetical predicted protein, partial [Marmota monax]
MEMPDLRGPEKSSPEGQREVALALEPVTVYSKGGEQQWTVTMGQQQWRITMEWAAVDGQHWSWQKWMATIGQQQWRVTMERAAVDVHYGVDSYGWSPWASS